MMVRKSNKNWLVVLTQLYILIGLVIVGIVYAASPSGFLFSAEVSLQVLCQLFLGLTIWFFVSWYLTTNRLFDPYVLFLLAAIIFNGGQIILQVFNLNENGFLDDRFPTWESLQVAYVVTISLTVMHFGALLYVVRNLHKSNALKFQEFLGRNATSYPDRAESEPATSTAIVLYSPSAMRSAHPSKSRSDFRSSIVPANTALAVGEILLYISILPVLVTAIGAIQVVKAGGYGLLYEQQAVTGIAAAAYTLADFIFPGVFLVIAGGNRKPRLRIFAVGYMLLYTCAKLTIGSRGAAVMPLLAMLWLWDSVVKPLPRTLLAVVAALMLLVVFPVIGATRNEVAGVDLFSIEFISKTLSGVNNPLITSISEMGFSATTIGWTMDLVPKVRPFDLGMSFVVAVATLIPNVFSAGRHPALTMSGYDTPDYWLVGVIDPEFAAKGGGLGFSFIAEAYLNFGWFGIILLGVIGFLFAKFVEWGVRDRDPVKMAIIAVFVSFFLFYPRGSCQTVFRPLVWYSLVPYLWMRWLSRLSPSRVKDLSNALRKGDK